MRPKAIPAYPPAKRSAANLAFSALLLTFLGWAILGRWSMAAHAGAVPYLVSTLACAPVLACALRRFHAVCPRHLRTSARPAGLAATRAMVLTLLFAVGALFGIAACTGSIVLVAVPAALSCFTPWTAIRAHQQHLLLSFLALGAGAALVPALAGMPLNLMSAMTAAWCLWALAAGLCIVLCGSELSKARRR
jgi:cbb3-type cytochrome oxidase subunit 1